MCPGNPLLDLLVLKSLVNELDDGIRFLLAQQEPVDESLDLRILAFGELAVSVLALNRKAHAILNSESLPNLTGCYTADVGSLVGQPFIIRVAEHQQGTRADEGAKLVVVIRESLHILVLPFPHGLLEPMLVSSAQLLDLAQSLRNTPRSRSTATRFLSDGKSYSLIKSPRPESHLTGV